MSPTLTTGSDCSLLLRYLDGLLDKVSIEVKFRRMRILGLGDAAPRWRVRPRRRVDVATPSRGGNTMTEVVFEAVEAVPIERMVVGDSETHHAGEVVGYRCQECGQADETLDQIWHQEDCPLAGEHCRQH